MISLSVIGETELLHPVDNLKDSIIAEVLRGVNPLSLIATKYSSFYAKSDFPICLKSMPFESYLMRSYSVAKVDPTDIN